MGLATSLAACTVGPDFSPPQSPRVPSATQSSAEATLSNAGTMNARWWASYGDPVLDTIEERVLANNLNLAEASTRIGRARAELRIAGALGLPRAGGAASYQRERASPKGIVALTGAGSPPANAAGGADPLGTATLPGESVSPEFDLFQAGFDANWELDLWGKARRSREAARANAQAARFERDAMRISLSAEVARTYVLMRSAEARLAILHENRKAVAAVRQIANQRYNHGASTRFDPATAATQVAAIDGMLPAAEREVAATRNALALLAGEEPHALDAVLASGSMAIFDHEIVLPGPLPSDLARSRPDIKAVEAALHAATARIGVAKADFYPSISLSGSAGLQSLSLDNLPIWDARQFVVGPILYLPVFEGGRLKGRLELARADEQAAAIRYRATVLRAWHEIDDALDSVRTTEAQLVAAKEGVAQSRVAAHISVRRYRAGATSYVDVLVAERARLESEARWVTARADRAIAVAALYKALGGGWAAPNADRVSGA